MAVALRRGDARLPRLLNLLRGMGVPLHVEYYGGWVVVGYEARAVWRRCRYEQGLEGAEYMLCAAAERSLLEALVREASRRMGLEPPLECPLCCRLFATPRDAGLHLQAHLDGLAEAGCNARGRRLAVREALGGALP